MKKLKKLSDKPQWFDICKYDKASSLGLKGWYEQIQKRVYVQDYIDIKINEPEYTYYDLNIDNWLHRIKIDPIFERNKSAELELLKKLESMDVKFINEAQESVRNFTAGDLKRITQSLDLMGANKVLIAYCKNEQYTPMNIDQHVNLHDKPVELLRYENSWLSFNSVALTVNLEASDEQLINDFQTWLKHARTNFDCKTIEEMFTDIDFNNWCEYAILPYFDLTSWAKLHNSEFTNSIMSEIIFPNAGIEGFCGESRVRRETKRRSAEIFRRDTSNAISAQVLKKAKF